MPDKIVCGYTKRDLSRKIIAISITEKLNPTFLAEWEKWHDNAPADPEPDGVQAAPAQQPTAFVEQQNKDMAQLREHLKPNESYSEAQTLRVGRYVLNEVALAFSRAAQEGTDPVQVVELLGESLKKMLVKTEQPGWVKSVL